MQEAFLRLAVGQLGIKDWKNGSYYNGLSRDHSYKVNPKPEHQRSIPSFLANRKGKERAVTCLVLGWHCLCSSSQGFRSTWGKNVGKIKAQSLYKQPKRLLFYIRWGLGSSRTKSANQNTRAFVFFWPAQNRR